MRTNRWWAAIPVLLLVLALLLAQGSTGKVALAETKTAGWQVVLDRQSLGGFHEVSGLESEYEVLETVCRADGRDNDCDGALNEVWLAGVYRSLWEMTTAVDELERTAAMTSRSRHDTVKNAIGNIRGLVRQTQEQIDGTTSLQARHDTTKNAIGNIRAAYRALGAIAIDEEGIPSAAAERMSAAIKSLQTQADGWQVQYRRAGKAKYKNIVLRAAPGAMPSPLLKWLESGERKSGSIIYLDRDGKEVMRFNFVNSFPVRYGANHLAEEMEFVVERVERAR